MNILVVADTPDRALYEYFSAERWAREEIELILACGDLDPSYLDFLVSAFNVPLYYVRGNHDVAYTTSPPAGAEPLHRRLVVYRGIRLLGFDGSMRYNGGLAQYTEWQMAWFVWWSQWAIRRHGGVDIVIAHSPPRFCPYPPGRCCCSRPAVRLPKGRPGYPRGTFGQACPLRPQQRCWDASDLAHRGFAAFRRLIVRWQPAYFVHGHTHLGYGQRPRELLIGHTRVVDAYGYTVLRWPPVPLPQGAAAQPPTT